MTRAKRITTVAGGPMTHAKGWPHEARENLWGWPHEPGVWH
jgi:hypothetical protein